MESDEVSQPLEGDRVGPGENPVTSPPPIVGDSDSTGDPQLAQNRAPAANVAWHRTHLVELNATTVAIISGRYARPTRSGGLVEVANSHAESADKQRTQITAVGWSTATCRRAGRLDLRPLLVCGLRVRDQPEYWTASSFNLRR